MIGAIMKTVDHIAIRVKNIDKCRKWWEDNCGAKCVYSTNSYHRMQLSNTTIALIDETTYEHGHVGILVNYKENLQRRLEQGKISTEEIDELSTILNIPSEDLVEMLEQKRYQKSDLEKNQKIFSRLITPQHPLPANYL